MQGIYQYIDKKTNEIVYIGKDSYIDERRRYNAHLAPSNYNTQPFNRVLQNNPDRYQYEVVYAGDFDNNLLNALEINSIAEFKLKNNGNRPKFNFTDGGEGICGFTHSEETKKKISETNTGKSNPKHRDDLNDNVLINEYFNNKLSTYKIAEKYNCDAVTVSNRLKKAGYNLRDSGGARNNSGYFRVYKKKCKSCKQGFTWRYVYRKNRKHKEILAVDIKVLEKKVKAKGLKWIKL